MTDGPRPSGDRSGGTRSSAGDPELIVAARAGDGAAFLVLRRRHEEAALRLATLFAGPGEAADALVRQAFDQARRTLESGGGPDCAFRLQILRGVRSAAVAAGVAPTVDAPAADDGPAGPATRAGADPVVRQSFLSLPERWGSVLWHTDVEHQSDAEVGVLLGMRTSTVTTLAARSRDGLVRGYLAGQVHQLDDPACAQVLGQLRRTVKGGAGVPQDPAVREHLDDCDGCRAAAQTLTILTGELGAVLAIVVLGEQGIPYLEAAGTAAGGTPAAAARAPARPRSMRLVLVAVALVAVTASVPALRAGAGQDSLAAVPLEESVAQAAQTAGTPGGNAAPGPATATDGAAVSSTSVPPRRTGSALPTTGRATITTTGVNGLPTRVSVSTMTSIGLDGVPTTVAVIPGVDGGPATTVTGSIPADGRPSGLPDFRTYYPGAPTSSEAATAPSSGGWPAAPTNPWTPPVFGAATPPQTSAPAAPGTTTTDATGLGTTTGAVDTPSAAATPTTPTTSTGTSTSTVVENPPPPGNPDPTTSSDEPTTDPTSDEPTTDPTDEEPTTSDPTTDADPEPNVMVLTPPTLVAFLPVLRTVPTFFTISNQTGAAIHGQTLTVSVPRGISASSITVDGSPGGCESTGAGTFSCEIPALSEDDRSRSVTLTLRAADDAESGDLVVSVTDHQQIGRISVLL